MTKDDAIRKALDYVQSISLDVGPITDVKFIDLAYLDEKARDCPPELTETYRSVRGSLRNHWVVTFQIIDLPGQISCPSTKLVCVFDSGEVSLFPSL